MSLEITLSRAQLKMLTEVAEGDPHSVTVRNEGGPFLLLDLHDARGMVVNCLRMPYEEDQGLAEVEVAPAVAPPIL